MKNVIRILVILLVTITTSCKAQQMVQTTADVYKLQLNEQQFINKPLKILLKEIKPQIKTADATNDNPYYFSFKFRTLEQRRNNEGSIQDKVSLYVYVNNPIDWKYEQRPKGRELDWTSSEIEKYGDLTVIRIKVIGKD
jgi:hypothetical protein